MRFVGMSVVLFGCSVIGVLRYVCRLRFVLLVVV